MGWAHQPLMHITTQRTMRLFSLLEFWHFHADADYAINYGGIGMVIGHEMTHGFDDQGAQYDEKGNLKNWWKKDDETKFKAKTGSVVYNTQSIYCVG